MSVLYQPVYIAHANMFYHEGKPVPIELSIATIPRDSKDFRSNCPENACLSSAGPTLNINERLRLKSRLPGSVPLGYLSFFVRGKFCHLGLRKQRPHRRQGIDQRKIFEKLGLFTINLEILPHFRDLNDRTLPDHLHDEVHEDYEISESTMLKSYRFARYPAF
ncbi:hypothetical protein TNCV_3100131 [Trichonephila clavipes]|nr:hypothetical protein TNCV_3100131 [Trichonephila clavipes]